MIDLIHDVAYSYRKLVKANSYPGDIYSLTKSIKNNKLILPFYEATIIMVYMLLDAEVSYFVAGDVEGKASDLIARLTYAKSVSVSEADFIFVLASASNSEKDEALMEAKIGTLINPHLSATVICEVESVSQGEANLSSGPGIKGHKIIYMDYFDRWIDIRSKKNDEYPLGIEMYFLDKSSDLMALPRTTTVRGSE
ncbi:MAG: phosphonate C-P lyase system protein PhnH [Clostridiales bacterium]|nr:phosphonate C-P lyase system protein PhnH [Clostridiales bacterium]